MLDLLPLENHTHPCHRLNHLLPVLSVLSEDTLSAYVPVPHKSNNAKHLVAWNGVFGVLLGR